VLPAEVTGAVGIKTDGIMYGKVRFTGYVNETRVVTIADSAAPVIAEAVLTIGQNTGTPTTTSGLGVLSVTFSEAVQISETPYPFQLLQEATVSYRLMLQKQSVTGRNAVFNVTGVEGVSTPKKGDLIYINPISAVGDSLVWQNNQNNRRVPLTTHQTITWEPIIAPNPFNPELPVFDTVGTVIRLVKLGHKSIPANIFSAEISIYDSVGNAVIRSMPFASTPDGYMTFYWSGANSRGRKVGDGTYIGIIKVNDEGAEPQLDKLLIGVSRNNKEMSPLMKHR
jgi:hypothetical protein